MAGLPRVHLAGPTATLLRADSSIEPLLRAMADHLRRTDKAYLYCSLGNLEFDVFDISARPVVTPAVYVFAARPLVGWTVLYVGMTADQPVSERMSAHPKLLAAMRAGATHLLVRRSTLLTVAIEEATLIRELRPILNDEAPSPSGGT